MRAHHEMEVLLRIGSQMAGETILTAATKVPILKFPLNFHYVGNLTHNAIEYPNRTRLL